MPLSFGDASFDVDVLIVGAGAAGLAAARELEQLGKSFVILEARSRVGGRVFTDQSLGAPLDAGAMYIHFADINPWRKIARELNFRTQAYSFDDLAIREFENGRPIDDAGQSEVEEEFDRLIDSDEGDVPDISFTARVAGRSPEFQRTAMYMAHLVVGEEPERVSARDYARLWEGNNLLVLDGYGTLVGRFAAGLPVRLDTPVRRISWRGQGVETATDQGTIRARAAIITVSVGVLTSGSIRFDPDLPGETQAAIDGFGMGALTKIGLRFNDRKRLGIRDGTYLSDWRGTRDLMNFDCFTLGRDLVIVTFGGDMARDLIARGEETAVAVAQERFAALVSGEAKRLFSGGRLYPWWSDPFARGCYSYAKPGHWNAREQLSIPVAEKLFFAGEATGGGPGDEAAGGMTAGGAMLAGRAAAREAAKVGNRRSRLWF